MDRGPTADHFVTTALFRFVVSLPLLLGLLAAASAQGLPQRVLPPGGQRGETGAPLPLPLVQIGRDVVRLAPGAVLYDAQNRTVLHGALPAATEVYYTTDAQGEVQRLYVLTPPERDRLDRLPRRSP